MKMLPFSVEMCSSTEFITPFVKQTWAASSVLISMIGQGMTLGYITCLIPALKQPDSPIKFDIASISWLASAFGSSLLIGILSSCLLLDRIGRRRTFLMFLLPGAAGWLIMSFARNYMMLLIGRILTGVAGGPMTVVGGLVIGEYTAPKHRGSFLNLKTTTFCLGHTIVHILGKYADWRTIAMLAMIPYIIAFAIAYTWPESPSWLISKNLFEKSEDAFFWLRGTDDLSKWEIKSMIKAQKERLMIQKKYKSVSEKTLEFFRKFKRRDFLKPVFISMISYILIESTMRHVYPSYALQIMTEVAGTSTLPFYYTLGMDLIIVFSSTFSAILVKIMKRRTLLFGSGISSLIVLCIACTYLMLVSNGILSKDRPWIGICLFALYFVFINLGCAPLPISLQGEIFPLPHREIGSAISGLMKSASVTVFLKSAPYLLENLKVYGAFLFFGSLMAVALFALYFILPETKDRSLQEIEDYFNHGKFINDGFDYDQSTHLNILNYEETEHKTLGC